MLEFSMYEDIPHLLTPVVVDVRKASTALAWCVGEMERRYKLLSHLGVRSLSSLNKKIENANRDGNKILNPFWEENKPGEFLDEDEFDEAKQPNHESDKYLEKIPKIIIVIDELADLMMVVGKKVEALIARLAQKARAAGIHLVLATQRPSVDVITGLIKANIPARMSYQVSSRVDSRTILDQMGAESLLGQGDMLVQTPGSGVLYRVHGAFVSDEEVGNVVSYIKKVSGPNYDENIYSELDDQNLLFSGGGFESESQKIEQEPLFEDAVKLILKHRRASISFVQRHMRIGYNRAARLLESMEKKGIVSEMQANGSRKILIDKLGEK
jgi:S-DNA-T family DNA segregation ATPase FtsK/SpoIIIE